MVAILDFWSEQFFAISDLQVTFMLSTKFLVNVEKESTLKEKYGWKFFPFRENCFS